jgi:kinesin family protein 13
MSVTVEGDMKFVHDISCCVVCAERLQHERQQALEKMGISVQASGIKVEKNKYYLVNLNADPSLNELLVYYLKVCIIYVRYCIL